MPDAAPAGRLGLPRNVLGFGVVSFLNDFASEMIYPLLPVFLKQTLHAGAAQVGGIEGAAEATASLLKLGSGWLSDRMERRKPLVVAGYAIACAARPLIAASTRIGHVMAVRVGDRVGKGLRTSPRDALLADSVNDGIRGRAYGFHRAMDHAGAVFGPLVAFALMRWLGLDMKTVFWLSAIPGALAVLLLVVWVKELPRKRAETKAGGASEPLGARFWTLLAVLLVFALANSADMFLLLRAADLGVPAEVLPLLWSALHVVKSLSSMPSGTLSDRVGRKPLLLAGWTWYALVYGGLALATDAWHAWALILLCGLFFGLTEGAEKALVADLAPERRRGAAFGWYNLTLGVGALPASLLFGWLWSAWSAPAAFAVGGALALASALLLLVLVKPPRKQTANAA